MVKTRIVTVRHGKITTVKSPDDDHHPGCQLIAEPLIDVAEMDRSIRADIRRTGKRPRDVCSVVYPEESYKRRRHKNSSSANFQPFSAVRSRLYRHHETMKMPVPDSCNIHVYVRTTLRHFAGENLDSDDVNYHETFSTLQRTRQSSHHSQRRHCIARRSSARVPHLRRYIRNGAKYGVSTEYHPWVLQRRRRAACFGAVIKHT